MSSAKKILWLLVAAVALLVASTAFYTIDETHVAVVTRFGALLPGVAHPGLHVKLFWPIDTVVRVDSRLLIFDNLPTELLTKDKKNVIVDSFVCWRVADPRVFAQTLKTRAEAEARLLDISSSELGAAIGAEPMESLIGVQEGQVKLREIAKRVAAAVDKSVRESRGIEVVDLQINGLNLPQQNRASVIKRMQAERDRIATKYRSEGEEQALKIEAQAAAEKGKILSEAAAKAEAIRGAGEARTMNTFAEAYAKDPEFYRFLRTLQSYEKILDEKTTIFLESNSKLLKALNGE